MKTVSFVIPCYNEEEVLPETARRLSEILGALMERGRLSRACRVVFVDDGSRDRTWERICALHAGNPLFSGIRLAHNRGHQNALLAGLMVMRDRADALISLDADLQDDVGVIERFIDRFEAGCDIVYGVRSSRASDTAFKRGTARAFYRLMRFLGVDIVPDHADYRLMSRRALDALSEYREVNLFLRGIVPTIGLETGTVEYERHERFAGKSKYPLKKMLSFAFEGITSFSVRPVRFILTLGAGIFLVSLGMLVYFLVRYFTGNTVQGWASIAVSVWALGGLQLLAIGVVGEYVGKVYLETKARPRYYVRDFLDTPPDGGQ